MDYMQGDDMANASTATFKVSVLRCRKTGRVLFLEAGKDFVDTLFSFLLLPVGTVLHMLSNSSGAFDATTVNCHVTNWSTLSHATKLACRGHCLSAW